MDEVYDRHSTGRDLHEGHEARRESTLCLCHLQESIWIALGHFVKDNSSKDMTLYHNSSIKTVILNMFPYNVCSLLALLNWIHARSLDYYDVFRFNICSIHASSTSLCEIHYGSLDNYVAMSCRYMFQGPKRRPPRHNTNWMAIEEI